MCAAKLNPARSFWVESENGLEEYTASEIFEQFREGVLTGESLIRILPNAPER